MTSSPEESFPVASNILLQNLVGAAHLNDKKGIVKSKLNTNGRQEIYVFEAEKSMAIKPTNLRYEPRELSSLSVPEMKGILNVLEVQGEWSGMDKDELRIWVKEASADTEDSVELARLVARANEPKDVPKPAAAAATQPSFNPSNLRQGAERMSGMSSDDLRRQAATMKAMGPAALRNMNPAMANMSDAQINMAIEQMEAVANNPTQLKMAADQMKKMSESELQQAVNQSPLTGPTSTSSTPNNGANNASSAAAPAINNISKSQFEQATQQMQNMSPDHLKQQANMLKSMTPAQLRASNPQFASMTDAQIQMSITQLEQMAENPEMVKMAADQMKNMSADQYESMKNMFGSGGVDPSSLSGGGSTSGSSSNGAAAGMPAGMPSDPSKMMEHLLSNPDQLNTVVKTMKQNPEMLKQMMTSQFGGGEGGKSSDAQKEQVAKAIDQFAQMDDKQLEKYLKMANGVQKVAAPVVNTFGKVKKTLGVDTKVLIVMINLAFVAFIVVVGRWWRARGGDVDGTMNDVLSQDEPPEIVAGYGDGEF